MLYKQEKYEGARPMSTYRNARRYDARGPWEGVRLALEKRGAQVVHTSRVVKSMKSALRMYLAPQVRKWFTVLVGADALRRERLDTRKKEFEKLRAEAMKDGTRRGPGVSRFGRGKLGRKIGR